MLQNGSTARRNVMIRFLAGMAMVCAYIISVTGVSSLVVAGSSTSAEARGGGRGGGGGRGRGGGGRGRGGGWGRGRGGGWGRGVGWGRGRGWGGVGIIAPGCYYSPRWGRTICPY